MNDGQRWTWENVRDAEFVRRVLIVLGIGLVAFVAWRLRNVLLLAFGAILVAVILQAFAEVLVRYARVPERWGLTAATVTILLLFAALMVLFGTQLRVQISNVAEKLPFALDNFSNELGLGDVSSRLPEMLGVDTGSGLMSRLAGIGGAVLNGLADFLLVVIAGIYIASSPRLYRKGLVKLFPISQHERAEGSLEAAGQALKLWLVGQLIAMTGVGLLSSFAFWMIGLPSPFALGLIAGLADFVPFVGPIIGALPAVLLAFTLDGSTVLWTVAAVVAIQQIEGNVITPLVQKRAVSIPPALALFAILAGGILFGTLGLIFGFPLAVVTFVLVKKLYVRETLGEETPVPGEPENPGVVPS